MTYDHAPLTGRLKTGRPGDLLYMQLPRHVKLYTSDKDEAARPRFVQVKSVTFSADMSSYRFVTVTGEVFVLRSDERITIIEQTAAEAAAEAAAAAKTKTTSGLRIVPNSEG